ncbi:MAG TPA: hypothetical protein VKZ79_24590 [Alphaproteobacteria bacterium]|nr:hypothetical protein [Alphaproteobacteria bacterium]
MALESRLPRVKDSVGKRANSDGDAQDRRRVQPTQPRDEAAEKRDNARRPETAQQYQRRNQRSGQESGGRPLAHHVLAKNGSTSGYDLYPQQMQGSFSTLVASVALLVSGSRHHYILYL